MVVDTQGSATFALASQPTLTNDVIVLALTNGNGITWSATSITLTGTSNTASTTFVAASVGTIALDTLVSVTSTSTEYANALSNSRTVVVRTLSSISWSVPSFVYVNLVNTSSITVSALPPSTTPLQLALSAVGVQFSPLAAITSTSSATQSFSLTGSIPATGITATLSIVSGGTFYSAPSTKTLDVRSLEIASIAGLPATMYLGQSVTVNITVTRSPPYAGTALTIAANSTVGTFSPATVSFAYGDTSLVRTVTFTATSSGTASFSLGVTGSAAPVYSSAPTAVTTVILPPQTVTLTPTCPCTICGFMLCSDNAGTFIYVESTLTVLVDIGTPLWTRTSDITIQLNYGNNSAVTYSQSLIVLAPNVNSATITLTGVNPQSVQLLTATVVVGAPSVIPGAPLALRILPKIPASLLFYPAVQLTVVGRTRAVPFTINSSTTSLAGIWTVLPQSTTEVSLSPSQMQFPANSLVTTSSLQITGLTPSALSMIFLPSGGCGMDTYHLSPSQFVFPVLAQRLVYIDTTVSTQYVLVGYTASITFRLQSQPTLQNDVITLSLQNSATITWASLTAQMTATNNSVTVSFNGAAAGIQSIASLVSVSSASTEYNNTLSNNFQVTVRTIGTVSWTLPTFVYVGLVNTTSAVTLSQAPPQPYPLTLTIAGTNLQFTQLSTFTSTSSTTQGFNVTGVIPSGTTTAVTVVASATLGTGSQFYATPATRSVEIRPLETVSLTGIPAQMYNGQTANATVQLSRVPQYPGTSLLVSLSSPAGTFSPSTFTVNYGDAASTKAVVFTASTTAASQSITISATGTAALIYRVVVPASVTVFAKERVSLVIAPAAVDSTSGFVYVQNSIELTVSLGTPAIYHQQSVSVQLSYGVASKVTFSANPVVFAAGVNSSTVTITGVAFNGVNNITASVITAADVFTRGSPAALRVLPLIPIAVQFNPATQLVVVNRTLTLTLVVSGNTTSLAGPVEVDFAFGPEITISTPIIFAQNSATTTATVTITALTNTSLESKNLTISLTGTGAPTYSLTQSSFNFVVLAQRYVQISAATDYMVVDTQGSATFALASQPTLTNDVIVLALTNGNGITWSATSITLTGTSNTANVAFTAASVGSIALGPLVSVTSTSTEYANALSNSLSVVVLNTGSISLAFPPFAYANVDSTFSVSLSTAPPPGRTVTVQCDSSAATLSPVTFTSSSSVNATAQFTPNTATPDAQVTCTLAGNGAPFFTVPQSASFIIRSPEIISVSLSTTQLYVNHSVVVTVSLTRDPQYAGTSLQVAASADLANSVTPANLVFQAGSGVVTAQFTFAFTDVGQATISLSATGSASSIYTPLSQTFAVTVFPLETVS
ncbi:Hypothetical protein, putative, partial [Bodo saltans]